MKHGALSNALIDNIIGDLGKPVHIGFPGPKVPAFDGVVEQSED